MFAILLLTVLAIGGAAIMQHAGSTVAIQKNKRAAIEAANQCLERLRTEPYENIDDGPEGVMRYIDEVQDDGSFRIVSHDPGRTVSINGEQRAIVVEAVRYDERSPVREYVQATVRVQYREDEWVSLSTILR